MNTVQTLKPPPVPDLSHPSALRSGVRVSVRPLQPTDREQVTELFTRLSPASRRDRFLTAMPRLSRQLLDWLADPGDGHDHAALALIVTPPGQDSTLIGVARFARNRHDRTGAEIAVTIDEAWHGQGAGTLLARELAAAAHEQGIGSFTASIRTSNIHALRMLQGVGDVVEWNIVGTAVEARIDLRPPVPLAA